MNSDLKRALGLRLQAARAHAKLTQEQLAERIERSPEAVSNIERGVSLPTLDTLARIAEAIGVPLGLFFEEGEQQPPYRAELETKLRLILRELSDRDAAVALGLVEVLRRVSSGR